ncbi:conserved hypothetical protein [Aspergillus fumigatus A1163]|uniref:Uncharacterized protein n=1 Tax=Aspergillus fumigatus (strain CBS 144.89 / FGSC A1163 / CEA10) TaxID=451804 RepID=B0Y6Q7_ASPFC|nr:conserved hypothetical protein [Aspergillus fumigatus A1163]
MLDGRIKAVPFEHAGNKVTVNTVPPVFNATASPLALIPLQPTLFHCFAIWGFSRPQRSSPLEHQMVLRLINGLGVYLGTLYVAHGFCASLEHGGYLLVDGHQSERLAQHEAGIRHYFASLLPAKAFVRCLLDHSILCLRPKRLIWQRIDDGARQLILVMARAFPSHRVHVKTRVTVPLMDKKAQFDHLIFAISADGIQHILGVTPTIGETEILQKLRTARHIMFFAFGSIYPPDITPRTCLTCVMNEGQNLSIQHFDLVLITLDPFAPPHPLLVAEVWEFTDLGICTDTLQVLSSLPAIQSKRGLSFCFSWTGHGVLEDAVTSGLTVAVEHLDAKVPFAFEHHPDISDVTELPQLHLSLADHLIRTLLSLFRVYVLVIEISLILLGALRGSLKNRMCLPRSERPFVLVELG